MRRVVGWAISAGLILLATAATAQETRHATPPDRAGVAPVSDIGGPYAAMPPVPMDQPAPPTLLPPREVYTVLRDYGYAPLGAPRQRGNFYSIAAVDRTGEEGRLVIDARNGRMVRFVPSYAYGSPGLFPPFVDPRRAPRPPAAVPHVASRSVPLPKAVPPRAVAEPKPPVPAAAAPAPAPAQQSAAAQAPAAPPAPPPAADAKPQVQIQPTQEMPKVQGLD